MKYLNPNSLFQTVDNVSEAVLFGRKIEAAQAKQISKFIISRQVKDAYADTFAPTETDAENDLILFTGERIKSRAGKYHMIGEEACRILRKLNIKDEDIIKALQKADFGLGSQIHNLTNNPKYDYNEYGMYCCKTCSCALWLNLASGGLDNDTDMLRAGLMYLKRHRDNDGSWKGFPSNYILYVLNEIEVEDTIDELKYAGLSIERKWRRCKK